MRLAKIFGILAMALVFAAAAQALEIISPENTTYDAEIVPLSLVSNETLDNITYSLDNQTFVLACENCSEFNDTLNVSLGNHTLVVNGQLGNETFSQEVTFSVVGAVNKTSGNETNKSINLNVRSPENITYDINTIPFNFSTDIASNMQYILNNVPNDACGNCTEFSTMVELENGDYNLIVSAFSGLLNGSVEVNFIVNVTEVNDTINETDDNETDDDNQTEDDINETETEDEPRFSIGFNMLPQSLANGEISDAELAEIIRNNKINPGVINRLIKTGLLEEISIEAILETQFNPPGILRKLLNFFGLFEQDSYSELIYETYNLSDKSKQKIVTRDDLPAKYQNLVKKELKNRTEQKISGIDKFEKVQNKPVQKPSVEAIKPKKEPEKEGTTLTEPNKGKGKSKEKKIFNAGKQNGKKAKGNFGKRLGKSNSNGNNNGKGKFK